MDHRQTPNSRLSRRQLAVLVAALVLLLAGGPAVERPEPALEESRVQAGAGSLDAAAIAKLLAEQNPNLSDPERSRIARAVLRYSAKYDLEPELVTGVLLVESDARPWVRSPKGAQGLMQVMPHMMQPMGMAGNLATIETNIEAGCIILAENIRRLGEADGVSAYFWGSRIRGGGYLQRVEAARAEVRAHASAS